MHIQADSQIGRQGDRQTDTNIQTDRRMYEKRKVSKPDLEFRTSQVDLFFSSVSLYLFNYLSIDVQGNFLICLFFYLSISLSVYLSIYLSIYYTCARLWLVWC